MNYLKALWKKYFGKTVDGVVADIAKKIDGLSLVAEAHKAEVVIHDDAVRLHSKLSTIASDEAARAERIAAKIRELLA